MAIGWCIFPTAIICTNVVCMSAKRILFFKDIGTRPAVWRPLRPGDTIAITGRRGSSELQTEGYEIRIGKEDEQFGKGGEASNGGRRVFGNDVEAPAMVDV